jgi:hypothetical protein
MREAMTAGGTIAPRIPRREALQVPAVLRSRNLIAGTLARLPIHLRNKEREIQTPAPFLDQIDPDIPNVVTFAETYEDLLFEGISWWKILAFDWRGYPVQAAHIHPDRVFVSGMVLPTVNGNGAMAPTSSKVYIDGLQVPDDQVIRFDSPNPALLVHAARAIRTCLTLDSTAARYASDPLPLGYFTPRDGSRPREDEDLIETLLTKWEIARNRRVWGYIGGAWEAKTLQFNAEQIQLSEQRQHAVLEIARAAGIDPEDLGVSTTSRTYQNSEQRRQDLIDFTFAPYVAAIEQRLSMGDVTPRGYEVKVNFDGFLRSDTKSRMEAYKIGVEVGAYTQDEIRELEDRPAIAQEVGPQDVPELPVAPIRPDMEEVA